MCGWVDDGQGDVDAHLARGGANAGTLWQARTQFLIGGACSAARQGTVRRPRADEGPGGPWELLDGVAAERLPPDDVRPWNLLHDGTVVGVVRRGLRASLTVDASYLRARFAEPGAAFVLELVDCHTLHYTPYDEPSLTEPDAIAAEQPMLLEARVDQGLVRVFDSHGVLTVGCDALVLRLDSGAPLAVAALAHEVAGYWDAWAAAHGG